MSLVSPGGAVSKKPFAALIAITCLVLSLVWMASCAFNVEAALARSAKVAAEPSHPVAQPAQPDSKR